MTLSEVLAAVADQVPYLRAVTTIAPDDRSGVGGDWWSCAELVVEAARRALAAAAAVSS